MTTNLDQALKCEHDLILSLTNGRADARASGSEQVPAQFYVPPVAAVSSWGGLGGGGHVETAIISMLSIGPAKQPFYTNPFDV